MQLLLCVVQQVNGYSYTDNLELQERFPMLIADQHDMNASAGRHEMPQPDHAEPSPATVLFTCFSLSRRLCLLFLYFFSLFVV